MHGARLVDIVDVSEALFFGAGIGPISDWSEVTREAYERALSLAPPENLVDAATTVDRFYNALPSRHAGSVKLILQFLVETPDQTFTTPT